LEFIQGKRGGMSLPLRYLRDADGASLNATKRKYSVN
jgi:hypothetical protein